MLETRAIVVHTEGEFALVEANSANGCSQCKGQGCGSSRVGQLFCNGPRQFKVDNRINAGVGDDVIISVDDGSVLRGVGLIYLLPLLLMFVGAVWAQRWAVQVAQHDGYAAIGALLGLVAGFALAKWFSSHKAEQRPFIARPYGE